MARKNRQRKKVKVHICTPEQYAGTVISARRKELGLSGKQLGQQIGVSQQQISRYERGVNRIHVDVLYSLSLVLGCKVNDFFSDIPSLTEASYYDKYSGAASVVIVPVADIKASVRGGQ